MSAMDLVNLRNAAEPEQTLSTERATAHHISGTIKLYDQGRGFGFVVLDRGGDAFFHHSVVPAQVKSRILPGMAVRCAISTTERGRQVTAMQLLEELGDGVTRTFCSKGTVKFYDSRRGFGFVAPADGSTDVFVGAKLLKKLGFGAPLRVGQVVRMSYETHPDGRRFAQTLAFLPSAAEGS